MAASQVYLRYAKSLLALAREQGQLEGTYADVTQLDELLAAHRLLRQALESPVISSERKLSILRAVGGAASEGPIMGPFFELLSRRGREQDLIPILRAFRQEYLAGQGITQGTVVSATPLDEAHRERLTDLARTMSGQQVLLTFTVDPTLIGGFRIRVGDLQLDQSASAQLDKLRRELVDDSYVSKL